MPRTARTSSCDHGHIFKSTCFAIAFASELVACGSDANGVDFVASEAEDSAPSTLVVNARWWRARRTSTSATTTPAAGASGVVASTTASGGASHGGVTNPATSASGGFSAAGGESNGGATHAQTPSSGTSVLAGGASSPTTVTRATTPTPSTQGLAVFPEAMELKPGAAFSFSATSAGTRIAEVTWSVKESNGGTIDRHGTYTAPAAEGTYHVVASTVAKPSVQVSGAVKVTSSLIVPAERRTQWDPGLNAVGGIRHRTAICATLQPSGGDDTAAIRNAIRDCPDEQVVKLEPGTFTISGDGIIIRRSNVTLRGSGPDKTLINKADELGDSPPHNPALVIGPKWTRHTVSRDLIADAAKGTSKLKMSDTSGLKRGELIIVNQISDEQRSDTVPPVRKTRWGYEQTDPNDGARRWYCEQNRPVGQVVEIEDIDQQTVTLTTPLHADFEVALQAHISRYSNEDPDGLRWGAAWNETFDAVKFTGIEDLAVANGGGTAGSTGNLGIFASAYCWIKNVESYGSLGTSCRIDGSLRCEVRDSYFHSTRNPNPGGDGYGLALSYYAADNLYENNIVWNFNKMTVAQASGGGNVFGYNYMQDGYGDDYRDLVEIGLGANHYAGNHMELFEGNESFNYSTESKFGNSALMTVFRNHFTGQRISAPPLQLLDASCRRMVAVDALAWWHSFVGNVLGFPNMPLLGGTDFHNNKFQQERFTYQTDRDWLNNYSISSTTVPVWNIGQDDPWQSELNPLAIERTFRHGNFDYVTNSVIWDESTPNRTLPASMYLEESPAFFDGRPWPWVTPEKDNPISGELPAKVRFYRIHGLTL